MSKIQFQLVSPFRDDVLKLMDLLNAHNLSHCPPEICRLTTAQQLAEAEMIGAFHDNELVGIGAIKYDTDYGEITRMYVVEQFRGRKISRGILDSLVSRAIKRQIFSLKLETSIKFKSAVQLYKNYGFTECAPFGKYVEAPYNTYMEMLIISVCL